MIATAERRIPADKIIKARGVPIADELERHGIELRRVGRELIGPCPVCGGCDRFGVNVAKGVWNCRRCQRGGDVIGLLQHLDGCDFTEAVQRLAGDGGRPAPPIRIRDAVRPDRADEDRKCAENRDSAFAIWFEARPIRGTLAARYLTATRCLELPPRVDEVLRFHPLCPFGPGVRHPCLLALYRCVITNEPRAIHRTALTPTGSKINRLTLGPTSGAAIKLSADDEIEHGLFVGEGVETTLSAMTFGLRPAWALGCAGAIKKFPVLTGIEVLTILADNDANSTGQDAARHCAKTWSAAGREVRLITPNLEDTDIADILSERAR